MAYRNAMPEDAPAPALRAPATTGCLGRGGEYVQAAQPPAGRVQDAGKRGLIAELRQKDGVGYAGEASVTSCGVYAAPSDSR
jgi:hypothetical protein